MKYIATEKKHPVGPTRPLRWHEIDDVQVVYGRLQVQLEEGSQEWLSIDPHQFMYLENKFYRDAAEHQVANTEELLRLVRQELADTKDQLKKVSEKTAKVLRKALRRVEG